MGRTAPVRSRPDECTPNEKGCGMKKYLLTMACLAAVSSTAAAQIPAIPGGVPGVAPTQSVTVANKCCSIWDFLGVGQIGNFVNNQIFKTRLFQAANSVVAPVARALGLGPSLLSDKFAKEGGAMGLANQLKKEEKKVPLKIQAIKYLGTLDCQCYPEIVDALLGSLDDCSEKVRYEALEALHHKCGEKKCHKCKHGGVDAACVSTCDICTNGNGPSCGCGGCACQKKVIDRLNQLLLARDEFGCLKEKSARIRSLATQMIEECLILHQPHPGLLEPAAATPEEVKPDPEPAIKPDPAKPINRIERQAIPQGDNRFDIRNALPKWFGGAQEEAAPAPRQVPQSMNLDSTSSETIEHHTVAYRAISPSTVATAPTPGGESVVISAPKNTWNGSQKRHLIGEIFGY